MKLLPPDFTSPGGAHVEPHIMLVVFLLSMNLIYFLILEGFMTEVENSWYRKRKNFIGKLKKHAVWNFYNNLLGGRSIHDNFMMNLAEFWNMWDLVYSGCGQGADIVGATHKKKGFNSIVILVAWQIWKHRNALYYGFFFLTLFLIFLIYIDAWHRSLFKLETLHQLICTKHLVT
ncbi:hypothetical protein ACJX0J_031280 [Zea mays]